MDSVELTVLKNLIFNEEYARKVIPFIQPEYFSDECQKIIFEETVKFILNYNSQITTEALLIEISNRRDLNETQNNELSQIISYLDYQPSDQKWLLDTTEKWCRDRAIYLALMESIYIADGNDKKRTRDAIPSILSEALSVSLSEKVSLCAMLLLPSYYKAGTFSTSLLKWRRRELLSELMPTYSASQSNN